ncbi:hypothetical protein JW935_24015 [candidate division KSB1 bacterium]|nr:hypothetical protein [candidate division KSB1 bacterium]
MSEKNITIRDVYSRQSSKEILGTTALYGPWLPSGEFDWQSYENLVVDVLNSGAVPATNVDTTWAIYNDWELTKQLIWKTAEIAGDNQDKIAHFRPLVVAGLNTNDFDVSADEITPTLARLIREVDNGLRQRGITRRIRYMPVPDKRLYHAPSDIKVKTYRDIGRMIGDFTDFGLVFFELDIGISGFGSNFTTDEISEILVQTPEIQEYKSALISRKSFTRCPYDYCDDLLRIQIVENTVPDRVQFSTGNDWFISLARYGKGIKNFGYLLGASQMSPKLFQMWRNYIYHRKACALALEQDLQAAAKDFWTPGNVGIYRHYIAVFLAMTGLISFPLPHPRCEQRYRVLPEDYFTPLRHGLRLGLIDPADVIKIVRTIIPGCSDMTSNEIKNRTFWMG